MFLPRLLVITDWSLPRDVLLARLSAACALGPRVGVQHRHPGASVRTFLDEGRTLAALCARFGNALFVNGRLDVALLLGAHLHLPAGELPVTDAKASLPGRWVSVAVHDAREAAAAAGADLALVSPVFAPASKPETRPPLLPSGFAALSRQLSCPAYALGGISPERAPSVPAAGYAVIGAVLHAPEAGSAARALL